MLYNSQFRRLFLQLRMESIEASPDMPGFKDCRTKETPRAFLSVPSRFECRLVKVVGIVFAG